MMHIDLIMMWVLGCVIGAVMVWLVLSRKLAAAVAESKAGQLAELATLQERVRGMASELEQAGEKLGAAERRISEQQQSLEQGRERAAQFEVKSARVPELEQQLAGKEQQFNTCQQELVRLTGADSEKSQMITDLRDRLDQRATEFSTLQEQLAAMQLEHRQLVSKQASLEEQAAQLIPLRAELESGKRRAEDAQQMITSLTERAGTLASTEQSLQQQLGQRSGELAAAQERIEKLTLELRQLASRQASLEEQAAQLTPLRAELNAAQQRHEVAQQQITTLTERAGQLASTEQGLLQQLEEARGEWRRERGLREQGQAEISQLRSELTEMQTRIEEERKQAEEKLKLLDEARTQLTAQFQNLANQILDEKSKKFTEQNQTNLGALLQPLQEKIREFQTKVEETYDKESKERFSLGKEIQRLVELNTKIGEDAVNLTQALKGSNKTQGVWGEIVLENVLESSGLRKGQEYEVQVTLEKEEGGQHRPDVVINLPEGKHMVVDSKVSLVAYERYTTSETEAERAEALKQHLVSVRTHIKGLSEKNYHNLHGLKSLDFVLLFIPVEPAFMLAVTSDNELFHDAFNRNVLLVSPSTLLATLRTIANIWRQEYQNRNAQEIAGACARLYDKFVGFVEDLEEVGKKLGQTQKAYDAAHNKLAIGKGNLIRQAEQVKKLGVKPNKPMPPAVLGLAVDDEDEVVEMS